VLGYDNGVYLVSIFEEYREADDVDGLVEVPPEQLELLDEEDFADWSE
jgi:hypothetical protein